MKVLCAGNTSQMAKTKMHIKSVKKSLGSICIKETGRRLKLTIWKYN
jgi:hypothetical protein